MTILVRGQSLAQSMSDYLIREIDTAPNVTVPCRVRVIDGSGTDHVQSLVVEDQESRTRRDIPADAVFVLIGSHPLSEWLGDSIVCDQLALSSLDQTLTTTPGPIGAPTVPPTP